MGLKGIIGNERRLTKTGKAPLLLSILILTTAFLTAAAPVLQAGIMPLLVSPMGSPNACMCHGDRYNEYVRIDSNSIPSQVLTAQTLPVFVNVTMNSTTYSQSLSSHWVSDLTVTVTSVYGYTMVIGSPQTDKDLLPNFTKEYSFNITGGRTGQDLIKVVAKITAHHGGDSVNDTVQGKILVNKPKQLGVLIALSTSEVKPGGELTLTVTVTDDTGLVVPDANVTLVINDTDDGSWDATTMSTGSDGSTTFNFTAAGTISQTRTVVITVEAGATGYINGSATGSYQMMEGTVERPPQNDLWPLVAVLVVLVVIVAVGALFFSRKRGGMADGRKGKVTGRSAKKPRPR